MADSTQFEILKKGTLAWHRWLNRNRNVKLDLSNAVLPGVNLAGVALPKADLSGANLRLAKLRGAKRTDTVFHGADLMMADLEYATMVKTDFGEASLDGCYVYGISAWDINLEGSVQSSLKITPFSKAGRIQVDSLE